MVAWTERRERVFEDDSANRTVSGATERCSKMTRPISRRKVLAAVGFSAVAGKLTSETMRAQSLPVRGVKDNYREEFFYREDWLGEPWPKPDPVVSHPRQRRIRRGSLLSC